MATDGLEDAYDGGAMGNFADMIAKEYQFTREQQDAYALETLEPRADRHEGRPLQARDLAGHRQRQEGRRHHRHRRTAAQRDAGKDPDAASPPSPRTARSPPPTPRRISDGAAALVLMSESEAKKRGLKPLARIVATAAHSHEPAYFTTAPVPAMKKALEKAGWKACDVDLWEINEAFAVVPMIAMKELGITHDKVNVNGGACALGHPIGASGARVLVTLINAMEQKNAKRGVAALCIGGGEGIAMAIERA